MTQNWQSLFEASQTAKLVMHENWVVSAINSAAEDLFQISREKAIQGQATWLLEKTSLPKAWFDTHIQSRQDVRMHDVRLLHQKKRYQCHMTPLVFQNDNTILLEFTATEPERSLLSTSAQGTRQQIGHQILRMLAHEIRNPIAGIYGAAQLLEQENPSELIRLIKREASRLDDMVKKSIHQQPMSFARINVHEPLEEALSLLELQAGDKIKIERVYDPSLPEVRADADALKQVFINLGKNAIEAMPSGGDMVIRSRFERGVLAGKNALLLDFKDQGVGIEPDVIAEIFYPYVSKKSSGTGLGLAISEQLIAAHDGAIHVQSEPGCTIFSIALPL